MKRKKLDVKTLTEMFYDCKSNDFVNFGKLTNAINTFMGTTSLPHTCCGGKCKKEKVDPALAKEC